MSYVKKQFEAGNDISWRDAVKGHTITQGLRYSLATGNWGVQGDAAIKPGVAQVLALSKCARSCLWQCKRRVGPCMLGVLSLAWRSMSVHVLLLVLVRLVARQHSATRKPLLCRR